MNKKNVSDKPKNNAGTQPNIVSLNRFSWTVSIKNIITIVRSIPDTQAGNPDNTPINTPFNIAHPIPIVKQITIDGTFLKSAPSAKKRTNTRNSIQLYPSNPNMNIGCINKVNITAPAAA
ncbi:hypothetical protein D3C76_1403840 [compost metagenome]